MVRTRLVDINHKRAHRNGFNSGRGYAPPPAPAGSETFVERVVFGTISAHGDCRQCYISSHWYLLPPARLKDAVGILTDPRFGERIRGMDMTPGIGVELREI